MDQRPQWPAKQSWKSSQAGIDIPLQGRRLYYTIIFSGVFTYCGHCNFGAAFNSAFSLFNKNTANGSGRKLFMASVPDRPGAVWGSGKVRLGLDF